MFIFIILLSLLSWLSHNKLKRDHYESFWVDTEETPDKPLRYGAVNAASTVILNPTSLTKKDIIEKVDVGTQSYKEASYYLIPMITKVKTALYNLNADYAKLTDEEKKLKKKLEALLKELNRLQSIITELKNNDNAGKRGLTAADYTKLNKIINAKENILSLVNKSIKDIDTKLLMEHFTNNMDTYATPGGGATPSNDTTGDIGTGGVGTIRVDTVVPVNSQVMGYSSRIDEQGEQILTKDIPQTDTSGDDISGNADDIHRSAREICESKVNTCYVRNTDETTDLTYELKNTIHVFDDNNYECTENRDGCIDRTDYNCPFDSCFFVNGADGMDYQYYTSNVIRDATIDNNDNISCIKSDLCQYSTEAAIEDKVRSNCEGGGSGDIMGNNHVPKYKCWTTTGMLIDSKASLAYPENWSKT
jgi:hypothetical protein